MKGRRIKGSIAGQLSAAFIGLIALVMAANILVNNFFLERFYIFSLENDLIQVYQMVNGHVTADTIDREYFENEISDSCSSRNMSLIVVDKDFNLLALTSTSNYNLMMARLNGYIIDLEYPENILRQTEHYTIQKKNEAKLSIEYLEMWGDLNSGGYFMIRIPVSSIRINARISNTFMLYISLAAMVIGGILIMLISRRFARPIRELTDLSRRMAELDFDARYTSGGSDEIGQLGEHFNTMSETLERTISELKSANNQLQSDIERKEKTDQMRREFLANVSHELKTPIALIQGYAEGLDECVNDDEESRRFYCEVIMDEASKMSSLVGKLMTLNQLEFGNDRLEMTRFDIALLIRGKIQSTGILAQQSNAEVIYEGRDSVFVWGDEFKVEEVLTNYLSNAFHHIDGERRIIIREQELDKVVRISVFNTGDPIPQEDIDHIWEKFYKVDKARTREYGGSGVGLSIVKAIMDAMHQQYGVINHSDGVEFWFELDEGDG